MNASGAVRRRRHFVRGPRRKALLRKKRNFPGIFSRAVHIVVKEMQHPQKSPNWVCSADAAMQKEGAAQGMEGRERAEVSEIAPDVDDLIFESEQEPYISDR
jgi:hypothetical protein